MLLLAYIAGAQNPKSGTAAGNDVKTPVQTKTENSTPPQSPIEPAVTPTGKVPVVSPAGHETKTVPKPSEKQQNALNPQEAKEEKDNVVDNDSISDEDEDSTLVNASTQATDSTSQQSENEPPVEPFISTLDIVYGVVLVLLIVGLICLLLLLQKQKKKSVQLESDLELLRNLLTKKADTAAVETKISGELTKIQARVEKLEGRIQQAQRPQTPERRTPEPPREVPPRPQPCKKYAQSIIDGVLKKVKDAQNEDSVFELVLDSPNATRAKLDICKEAYNKVKSNPAFLDGCDKQILGSESVSTTPGIAILDTDGDWKVATKPKVIIK